MAEHFEKVVSYVMSNDKSEIANMTAERDYALHCLEREIYICAQTTAGFLSYVQIDNKCKITGKPCREWQKCGCYQEMEVYIRDAKVMLDAVGTPPGSGTSSQ